MCHPQTVQLMNDALFEFSIAVTDCNSEEKRWHCASRSVKWLQQHSYIRRSDHLGLPLPVADALPTRPMSRASMKRLFAIGKDVWRPKRYRMTDLHLDILLFRVITKLTSIT